MSTGDAEQVRELIDRLNANKSYLKRKYKFLGEFDKSFIRDDEIRQLTKYGEKVVYDIAKRFRENNPIFDTKYNAHKAFFRTLNIERCISTAQIFGLGIFYFLLSI